MRAPAGAGHRPRPYGEKTPSPGYLDPPAPRQVRDKSPLWGHGTVLAT